jgi:hypothetical protein
MQTTYHTSARGRLCACVAAMILCASGSAGAAETLTFDELGNASFQLQHVDPGAYVDSYVFSVTDALVSATGAAIAGRTKIDGSRLRNYAISDITFFSERGGVRTNLATSFEDNGIYWFYPIAELTEGNYGFTVTGYTLLSGKAGAYAGTLTIMAAVPEPATYAMLGLGLGILALTSRRKANNKLG